MNNKQQTAFPTIVEIQPEQVGLTKREYFAAKAMQAYASSRSYATYSYDTLADYAVKLADRVLAELAKKE